MARYRRAPLVVRKLRGGEPVARRHSRTDCERGTRSAHSQRVRSHLHMSATAARVAQAVKNLAVELEDTGCRARFPIREWDGKFPAPFDAVLADAGSEVVLTGVRMPRTNSIMERRVQTCRRELLGRTVIWNQRHLLHALREFGKFCNSHRPE
ncbi:hypothetical protein [Streptomyces sp. AC558_RSS880]|uniref:hypothetical protein n=1 Tax=Streptomyces sp. AC558_RSS880 TaxID=2823687 RepID=UPI0027E413EE|nr:hypothetical protein [Streptomyces sp. AC558_RSS880]